MYLDQNGLIVQKDGDGGDTLQRIGFWFEGLKFNPDEDMRKIIGYRPDQYVGLLQFCKNDKNQYFRNPKDWDDPKDCSRDQLVPNIRAMGYYDMGSFAKEILVAVLKNFSRFPNGDVAFIQDYARFARTLRLWWLYPLILFGDLFMLISSFIRIVKGMNYDDVGDDINHIGDLAQARAIYPTPISWLARLFYIGFRPSFVKQVDGGIVRDKNGIGGIWALNWYFREESGGNPEFAQLWSPVVRLF